MTPPLQTDVRTSVNTGWRTTTAERTRDAAAHHSSGNCDCEVPDTAISRASGVPANQTFLSELSLLNRKVATGCLTVRCGVEEWFLFFELGCLTWAGSNCDRQRQRWQRQYKCLRGESQLPLEIGGDREMGWDYRLSFALLERQLLGETELGTLAAGMVREILFDILQAIANQPQAEGEEMPWQRRWESGVRLSRQYFIPSRWLEPTQQILLDVWQEWSAWERAGLAPYSPNQAPHAIDKTNLKLKTSGRVFSLMVRWFDGNYTLRDAVLAMGLELQPVAASLLPLTRQGIVRWEDPGDSSPEPPEGPDNPEGTDDSQGQSIVCVDDSLQCCEILRHIVTRAGHRCLTAQQSVEALNLCVEAKPDLIFLDLMMPVVNGYELCAQLRRVAALADVPIVILSSRDGMVDKVRAKLVGATDYLAKPITRDRVIAMLEKYALAPSS